ncbi:X-linked retinitis pigmentosa GTPase regulator-interacting protein 1 [Formica fusca]
MADDPNRDILPVKEGSVADTIISGIDPRERHLVCKLDRYQLEDKYLRLLDETNNLKKLSNCQEDKIKRLGTKLIRLASNPRSCGLALDIADDRNKMTALELENTKLKEKIAVMRNQLLSHTINGRSSSRSRNLVRPSSSGLVTCRSENNRTRVPSCQCIVGAGDDDNDMRNYILKIEKLEAQKKDMACRITELEKELALSTSTQKEKIAENVEYIRVWRQMKQLNDKLMTAQEKNAALTTEINDLKKTLERTTRNNQEIAAVLTLERTRIAEIDHQMLKAKSSQLTLREKDEQIRDFMNEIKILQQHNNELIGLTSKYGQVEFENIELRKKLSENTQDQQSLKIAFNNEQANIITLKATNERLLAKLQELQTNIDTLTVQVASFHKQNGKCDAVNSEMTLSSDVKQCMKCCEMYDKIMQLEKPVSNTRESLQLTDKSVQTIIITASIKEQSTMTRSEEKINEKKTSLQSPLKEWKTNPETNGTNVLSREKILKLLDQAQINTPLDASRMTPKEEYTGILDISQRHSDGEISSRLLRDESNPESSQKRLAENPNLALNQIFLTLYDVLQEYISFSNADERTFPSHQVSTLKNSLIDANNNNLSVITTRGIKQNCLRSDAAVNFDSDRRCTSCAPQRSAVDTKDSKNFTCEKKSATVLMKDTGSSMKGPLDIDFFPLIHEKYRKSYRDISKDFYAEKTVKKLKRLKTPHYSRCNLTCHLRKAKDPLEEEQNLPCRIECLNDSMKLPVCPTECFPLLITDRQGLIEIHISRLQLSTSVAKIPEEEDICNLHIYISWDIWGEKTAYTPKMKCPNLIFNSSSVYRIADLFSFFKNVLSEYLVFRVNIVRRNDTSSTLARAKVSIKDILDYPQNKLHYVVPVNSVISCFFGVNFGQLSLWVRLSCNVDMVEAFKKQCGITSLRDVFPEPLIRKDMIGMPEKSFVPSVDETTVEDTRPKDEDLKDSTIHKETKELHIRSPLDITADYDTENSEDDNYFNSNNEDLNFPRNDESKKSEEDRTAIRSPDSDALTDSNNERQRSNDLRDSASMMEFRTLMENHLEKDTITIEIVSIQLLDESFVMQDDEIHLLYVEYSFLGHCGEDMETVSVTKPKTANQEIFYNFKRTFRIDEKTHPVERNSLRSMLAESTSPNVKFIIISEPLPEETDIKDCEEIGYAIFNIKQYALGDGSEYVSLPIKDDRNRQIGTLKIVVSGFDVIQQCLSDIKAVNND